MTVAGSPAAALAVLLVVALWAEFAAANSVPQYRPGEIFRDCDECPELVVVPAGQFIMGSDIRLTEGPARAVRIARPFAIGRYEVTAAEWRRCVEERGCIARRVAWRDLAPRQPIGWISWHDAYLFVRWLSRRTGHIYRLPTEAEWEFAARAGASSTFWWGDTMDDDRAQCRSCRSGLPIKGSVVVGGFAANAFGLFDMTGNVWEWVQDCYQQGFFRAPPDGGALNRAGCERRVMRGGGWDDGVRMMAVTTRLGLAPTNAARSNGLRVARSLAP